MDRERLIRRLMATFLDELDDHVRSFDRGLLALEAGPDAPVRSGLIQDLFRTAHSLKGAARSVGVATIEAVCHHVEELLAAARDGRLALGPEHLQLLFATADAIRDASRRLRDQATLEGSPLEALLGRLTAGSAQPTSPAGPIVPAEEGPPPVAAPEPRGYEEGLVRIPGSKLDRLLARSGELLTARQRLDDRREEANALLDELRAWQLSWRRTESILRRELAPRGPGAKTIDALAAQGERVRRTTRKLERIAMGLASDRHFLDQTAVPLEDEVRRARLVPFAGACEGLDRAVRDLVRSAGKLAALVVEGGDLELDRALLPAVKESLLHLVRNAIDHGIEAPDARRAAGKPASGRIVVSAALRGPRVEVAVEDDGQGLDLGRIRERARERGIAVPEDEAGLARLVFLPGFSTRPRVSAVSGRGVGLDVVRARAESLRGSIDLSSEAGRRSRFVLSLPLTLSKVRALLVVAGGRTHALDSASVRTLRAIGPEDLRSVEGRDVILHDGAPVPLLPLAELLDPRAVDRPRPPGRVPVVVLSAPGGRLAVAVDELLAEQEVTLQGLGPRLAGLPLVSGATILSSGRIVMILDATELVERGLGRTGARSLSAAFTRAAAPEPRRLLVVDDSVTTRTLVQSILEGAGYEVRVAADGREAWHLVEEGGIDLIVADVEMPVLDGIALCKLVRSSRDRSELPVVLVTALDSEKDRARGLAAGADAYLVKSGFDQTELLRTIEELL